MPEGIGADPDVTPGRWDAERVDALDHLEVPDRVTLLVEVLEAAPAPTPSQTGRGAVGTTETRHASAEANEIGEGEQQCQWVHDEQYADHQPLRRT